MKVLNRLDNSLDLPEEERLLLDAVRALCRDQIRPRAAAYDKSGEFPWDNIDGINELGLNGMFIPEEYGGAQMTYCAYLATVREIGKACAATGLSSILPTIIIKHNFCRALLKAASLPCALLSPRRGPMPRT